MWENLTPLYMQYVNGGVAVLKEMLCYALLIKCIIFLAVPLP